MYSQPRETEVDLEVEYSPSLNTKRFQDCQDAEPNECVLENFVKVTKADTEHALKTYKWRQNVRYGGAAGTDDNQVLDIFFKDQERCTPIFVFIHGGFWQCLNKSTSGSFVAPWVERNYRVVNVDYNLCPTVSLQELCSQMLNFFEWLFLYATETEASSIVIVGHSAGAHLAALLLRGNSCDLLTKSSIKISLVLISGLFDLRELWDLECSNPQNVLGLTAESAIELSPLCWELDEKILDILRRDEIQIHILAAENDSNTFKAQSLALAERWKKLGLNISSRVLENYDHFDIIEEASKHNSQITKYLLENLL